jgi:hypothetical protein
VGSSVVVGPTVIDSTFGCACSKSAELRTLFEVCPADFLFAVKRPSEPATSVKFEARGNLLPAARSDA